MLDTKSNNLTKLFIFTFDQASLQIPVLLTFLVNKCSL